MSRKQLSRPDFNFENLALQRGFKVIAGIDEAGRGPLAGPVVAAACVVPYGLKIPGVNDSKQLTPLQRYQLFEAVMNHPDIYFGIGIIDALRIDQINILQATFEAMLIALKELQDKCSVDYALVDGSLLPSLTIPGEAIVEGDGKSVSIALASILAKETRDRLMGEYDKQWPEYLFKKHKGYATEEHFEKINIYGPCPIHRMTFSPFKSLDIQTCSS